MTTCSLALFSRELSVALHAELVRALLLTISHWSTSGGSPLSWAPACQRKAWAALDPVTGYPHPISSVQNKQGATTPTSLQELIQRSTLTWAVVILLIPFSVPGCLSLLQPSVGFMLFDAFCAGHLCACVFLYTWTHSILQWGWKILSKLVTKLQRVEFEGIRN